VSLADTEVIQHREQVADLGLHIEGLGLDIAGLIEKHVEELAQLLVTKAMEGKLESVKMLIKMAEEEKVMKEKRSEEEGPTLNEMLWGSNVRIGQVWDGRQWKRLPKTKILEAKVVEEVEERVDEGEEDLEDGT